MRRWFPLAASLFVSTTAVAQSRRLPDTTGVMPIFVRFADIYGGWLVAAFDSIPAARYGYSPMPAQRTIGNIAQHLETANYGLCERLGGRHPRTAKDSLPESIKAQWPKDTLVARLEESLRFCDDVILRTGPLSSPQTASTLIGFETDLAEHYSQLSVYMRILGLVPPSAIPPKQRTAISLPESTLSNFVGRYEISPGGELIVTMNSGALFIRSTTGGGAAQLWPESASDFFVKEAEAQITFTRGQNGTVTGLVLHQFGRDRPAKKITS